MFKNVIFWISLKTTLASLGFEAHGMISATRESSDAGRPMWNASTPPPARNGRALYPESFEKCLRDRDYGPPLEYALTKYRQDSDPYSPNRAPKEVWPSTSCFRHIFYQVGKRLGRDADVYLERIPDRDFRLFAQIELAAALAGLPEFHETERTWRGDIRTDRNSMTA